MKKFLSMLLATVMVVAAVMAVLAVPTAAADGIWSVYAKKDQYIDGYTGIMSDIPGYEYTDEGLKMIPAEWKDSNPYATFQTSEKVYLADGVYLEVRVDQFSYGAGDRWFGFSIWDQQNVSLGAQGEDYGYGVETLIRHNGVPAMKDDSGNVVVDENGKTVYAENPANYNAEDKSTWAGAATQLEWYKDLQEGQRINCGPTPVKDSYDFKFDENGCPILVLEIKWDAGNEMCVAYINGVAAPDTYNQAIKDKFEADGWMAYVGFSLQNNMVNGTIGCTILKFGTSEADAEPPVGDDEAAPRAFSNEKAPLADSSTVAEGTPAIRLTGSVLDSNVAGKPSSFSGNIIVVNDDSSVTLTGAANGSAYIKFTVDNTVSYAAEDFPIILFIMRNYCTCTYTDEDGDGVLDEYCECTEQFNTLVNAGDIIADDSSYSARATSSQFSPVYDEEGNSYTYFTADMSTSTKEITGRLHALRLDIVNLKSDRLDLDICEIALFRTANEAEAYFNAYMESITGDVVTPPEDTDTTVDTSDETEPTVDDTTVDTSDETEPTTEQQKPADDETETEAPKAPADVNVSVGCNGVVGVGAVAVVAIAVAGLVSFKKKED